MPSFLGRYYYYAQGMSGPDERFLGRVEAANKEEAKAIFIRNNYGKDALSDGFTPSCIQVREDTQPADIICPHCGKEIK